MYNQFDQISLYNITSLEMIPCSVLFIKTIHKPSLGYAWVSLSLAKSELNWGFSLHCNIQNLNTIDPITYEGVFRNRAFIKEFESSVLSIYFIA